MRPVHRRRLCLASRRLIEPQVLRVARAVQIGHPHRAAAYAVEAPMRAERRPRIYINVVFDDGAGANHNGRIDLRLP